MENYKIEGSMIFNATIYEAWSNGKSGFSSFEDSLFFTMQKADAKNAETLRNAFPQYFEKRYKSQFI